METKAETEKKTEDPLAEYWGRVNGALGKEFGGCPKDRGAYITALLLATGVEMMHYDLYLEGTVIEDVVKAGMEVGQKIEAEALAEIPEVTEPMRVDMAKIGYFNRYSIAEADPETLGSDIGIGAEAAKQVIEAVKKRLVAEDGYQF